mmetsp:Transcript_17731/g.37133  ORF Transcript_17731/g.37133 Transcript_17731/m.37133 type:complete len:181 (-) Transcript_17731:30-572(-)
MEDPTTSQLGGYLKGGAEPRARAAVQKSGATNAPPSIAYLMGSQTASSPAASCQGAMFDSHSPCEAAVPKPPFFLTDPADFPADIAALQAVEKQAVESCGPSKHAVDRCKSGAECNRASIAHLYCMATLLCKRDAAVFQKMTNNRHRGKEDEAEAAFRALEACMGKVEDHTRSIIASARR